MTPVIEPYFKWMNKRYHQYSTNHHIYWDFSVRNDIVLAGLPLQCWLGWINWIQVSFCWSTQPWLKCTLDILESSNISQSKWYWYWRMFHGYKPVMFPSIYPFKCHPLRLDWRYCGMNEHSQSISTVRILTFNHVSAFLQSLNFIKLTHNWS